MFAGLVLVLIAYYIINPGESFTPGDTSDAVDDIAFAIEGIACEDPLPEEYIEMKWKDSVFAAQSRINTAIRLQARLGGYAKPHLEWWASLSPENRREMVAAVDAASLPARSMIAQNLYSSGNYHIIAHLYTEVGYFPERAEKYLEQGLRLNPMAQNLVIAGLKLSVFQEDETGVEDYMLRLGPLSKQYMRSFLNFLEMLLERGRSDQCHAIVKRLSAKGTDPIVIDELRADLYIKTGRTREAIALLEDATEKYPDEPYLQWQLGAAYAAEKSNGEALAAFYRACRIAPDDSHYHRQLAKSYLQKGFIDAALFHVREGDKTGPEDAGAKGLLGETLLKKGEYKEALQALKQAINMNSVLFDPMKNISILWSERNEPKRALGFAEMAAVGSDQPFKGFAFFAGVLVSNGRLEDAVRNYRKALSIEPDEVSTRYELGKTLIETGEKKQGYAEMKRAVESQFKPNVSLGNRFENFRLPEDALNELVVRYPDWPTGWFALGKLLLREKRYGKAVEYIAKARSLGFDSTSLENDLRKAREGNCDLAWLEEYLDNRKTTSIKRKLALAKLCMRCSKKDKALDLVEAARKEAPADRSVFAFALSRPTIFPDSDTRRKWLDDSLAEFPDDTAFLRMLGVSIQDENPARTREIFKSILDAGKGELSDYATFVDLSESPGKDGTELSEKYVEDIVKKTETGNAEAVVAIARFLLDAARPAEAAKTLRKSLDMNPVNFDAWTLYAEALEKQGLTDDASKAREYGALFKP